MYVEIFSLITPSSNSSSSFYTNQQPNIFKVLVEVAKQNKPEILKARLPLCTNDTLSRSEGINKC